MKVKAPSRLGLVLTVTIWMTGNAVFVSGSDITPRLVRLASTQPNYIYPDDEYCIVPQKNERKARLKLKLCDDPLQANTRSWIIDGYWWKSFEEPNLCVEVAKVQKFKVLRLNDCANKGKQKWLFGDNDDDESAIRPKKDENLCIAYESDFDESSRDPRYDRNGGAGSASAGSDIMLVDCDTVIDCDTQDSPCMKRPALWEISDASTGVKDATCKMLRFVDVEGNLCLHGMWGRIQHGNGVDGIICDEDDEAQYWCPDDQGR